MDSAHSGADRSPNSPASTKPQADTDHVLDQHTEASRDSSSQAPHQAYDETDLDQQLGLVSISQNDQVPETSTRTGSGTEQSSAAEYQTTLDVHDEETPQEQPVEAITGQVDRDDALGGEEEAPATDRDAESARSQPSPEEHSVPVEDSDARQPELPPSGPTNVGRSGSRPRTENELPPTPLEERLTMSEFLREPTEPPMRSVARRTSTIPPASPPLPPPPHTRPPVGRNASEFILPRWQPDAEVTLCPICSMQFGFFVRKHHCRKCGRVVCNACSPHRIVIPHQYIVRPPGEYPYTPYSFPGDEGPLADLSSISGGERVRLCNPCVPDPNMTPPQSHVFPGDPMSPRLSHHRSHSSSNVGDSSDNSYFAAYMASSRGDAHARSRSITVDAGAGPSRLAGSSAAHYYAQSGRHGSTSDRFYPASYSSSTAHTSHHHGSQRHHHEHRGSAAGLQSSINRPLPPAPQIPEEDECPICHFELPSRDLPDFEAKREAHVEECIATHSNPPRNPRRRTLQEGAAAGTHGTPPPRTERRTGMFPYVATEKDCVDDAECTICFEEYEAGDQMCRLECLCRFHRVCIAAWFENHPGRCPVHQHDSYGY